MNVLLYVFDALRADHVSSYGYERDTTPNIDRLSTEGVLFENCFSPTTWTRAVAVSILTGVSPLVHGTKHIDNGYNPPLPPLSEQFQRAGYDTVGIGSMPNLRGEWGFNRGFDTYRDMYKDDAVKARRDQLEPGHTGRETAVSMTRAEDVNRGFIDWYESSQSEGPFFGLLWSNETHAPYAPPEDFEKFVDPDYGGPVDGSPDSHKNIQDESDTEHLRNLYDSEIRYADHCFGELYDYLKQVGELNNTLLIALADHGDAFGEHGQFGHGIAPHDTVTHVPLVVRPPRDERFETVSGDKRRSDSSSRIKELTSLLDLYPTLIDCMDGIKISEDIRESLQGVSLLDALRGKTIEGHDYVFHNVQLKDIKENYDSVRSSSWRYMKVEHEKGAGWGLSVIKEVFSRGVLLDILKNPRYYLDRHLHSDDEWLYNLEVDPGEQNNIIEQNPEVTNELSSKLETWQTECETLAKELEVEQSTIRIEGESRERLKKLGYLEE